MSAGPKYEWYWADGKNIKKPIGVSAPEYVDYLMEWIQSMFEDPTIFPPEEKQGFPPTFVEVIKQIFKRLFRVFAHIYYHHTKEILQEGVEAALNTGFKHFYLFVKEFDLIDPKDMVPLEHLTKK
jgi:MOB kinase activator 1